MDSVSAVNPVLTSLLKTLSAESPEFSAIVAAPRVQSALENASPRDLVALSNQALQLQQVGLLFGNPGNSSNSGEEDLLTQALQSSLTPATAGQPASGTTASSNFQSSLIATLFGNPSAIEPLFNVLG